MPEGWLVVLYVFDNEPSQHHHEDILQIFISMQASSPVRGSSTLVSTAVLFNKAEPFLPK